MWLVLLCCYIIAVGWWVHRKWPTDSDREFARRNRFDT